MRRFAGTDGTGSFPLRELPPGSDKNMSVPQMCQTVGPAHQSQTMQGLEYIWLLTWMGHVAFGFVLSLPRLTQASRMPADVCQVS